MTNAVAQPEATGVLALSNGPWHARTVLMLGRSAGWKITLASETAMRAVAIRRPAPAIPLGKLGERTPRERAALLDKVARETGSGLIFPVDRRFVRLVAECATLLSTPTTPLPTPQTLRTLANKAHLADWAREQRIPIPRSHVVRHMRDLPTIELGYPRVVKPARGENGRLVRICHTPEAQAEAVGACLASDIGPAIVQEFVTGVAIGACALCRHGEIVTHATKVHTGDRLGSIRLVDDPAALDLARRICNASAMHGLIDFDMMREAGSGRTLLIECNPRLWASSQIMARRGVNFVDHAIRLAKGLPIAPTSPRSARVSLPIFTRAAVLVSRRRRAAANAAGDKQEPQETNRI